MDSKISFKERAKLGMEQLFKRRVVTLEEARSQAKWLKAQRSSRNKKFVQKIADF